MQNQTENDGYRVVKSSTPQVCRDKIKDALKSS